MVEIQEGPTRVTYEMGFRLKCRCVWMIQVAICSKENQWGIERARVDLAVVVFPRELSRMFRVDVFRPPGGRCVVGGFNIWDRGGKDWMQRENSRR